MVFLWANMCPFQSVATNWLLFEVGRRFPHKYESKWQYGPLSWVSWVGMVTDGVVAEICLEMCSSNGCWQCSNVKMVRPKCAAGLAGWQVLNWGASKQGREAEAGQGRRAETSKVGNTAWKYLAARQADKGELGNTNLSSRYMCFVQAYKEQVQVRWEHCCLLPSYRWKQISRQGRGEA